MSQFTGQMNAREILYAMAGVQRQQEGIRTAKSGLSGQLMALAKPFSVTHDKEYSQCINDMERASRAEVLAKMFAEYLEPVETDFKKRENTKIPGAWSQAKSDIKAAIKLELAIEEFDSFDTLKKEKLAANKARKAKEEGTGSDSESDGESAQHESVIETDSPVIAELLNQFSDLISEALKAGKTDEVQSMLEDACLRMALATHDEKEATKALTQAA